MISPVMTKEQFHQGAKVKRRYFVAQTLDHARVRTPLDERDRIKDAAYELSLANQHKPWARRWLRERRYL